MKFIYIWQSDYLRSLEYAVINKTVNIWKIDSSVIISSFQGAAYKIDYLLELSDSWKFKKGTIKIDNMGIKKTIEILLDENGRWNINNQINDSLSSCIDIDLGFTPLTNTLPINRLHLGNSESASINAAWIQFPTFEVKPLEQRYIKIREDLYLYESGTNFKADLKVNKYGFVTDYQNYWKMIQGSCI